MKERNQTEPDDQALFKALNEHMVQFSGWVPTDDQRERFLALSQGICAS